MDFGAQRNVKDIAAVSAVCKTLQTALKLHPAWIELEGVWTQTQLAGLCKTFPKIVTLVFKERQEEHDQMSIGRYIAQSRTINPQQLPMLACQNLCHLDLSFLTNKYSKTWSKVTKLSRVPRQLTGLSLPRNQQELPDAFCQMVEALPKLKALVSLNNGFWGSPKLTSLESLAVGGAFSMPLNEKGEVATQPSLPDFCAEILGRLSKLTSLYLKGPDSSHNKQKLTMLDSTPKLLHLVICGYVPAEQLAAFLAAFRCLESLVLAMNSSPNDRAGSPELNKGLLSYSCSSLRKLCLETTAVDIGELHIPDNLALEELQCTACSKSKRLTAGMATKISQMASLTTLELLEWTEWDADLSPLSRLTALLELKCSSIYMLADMLLPGGLHTVTAVGLCPLREPLHYEKWRTGSWLSRRALTEAGFFKALSAALIKMPNLESLEWLGQAQLQSWDFFGPGSRVLNDIVAASPQHWLNTAKQAGGVRFTRFRG